MLNLDSTVGVGKVIGMESQKRRGLEVAVDKMRYIQYMDRLTSDTEGTVKLGTPFAKLPKPASEPQTESANSSSST